MAEDRRGGVLRQTWYLSVFDQTKSKTNQNPIATKLPPVMAYGGLSTIVSYFSDLTNFLLSNYKGQKFALDISASFTDPDVCTLSLYSSFLLLTFHLFDTLDQLLTGG